MEDTSKLTWKQVLGSIRGKRDAQGFSVEIAYSTECPTAHHESGEKLDPSSSFAVFNGPPTDVRSGFLTNTGRFNEGLKYIEPVLNMLYDLRQEAIGNEHATWKGIFQTLCYAQSLPIFLYLGMGVPYQDMSHQYTFLAECATGLLTGVTDYINTDPKGFRALGRAVDEREIKLFMEKMIHRDTSPMLAHATSSVDRSDGINTGTRACPAPAGMVKHIVEKLAQPIPDQGDTRSQNLIFQNPIDRKRYEMFAGAYSDKLLSTHFGQKPFRREVDRLQTLARMRESLHLDGKEGAYGSIYRWHQV